MGRTKMPYLLWKKTNYYYYKLPSMKSFMTTNLKSKAKAECFVLNLIEQQKLAEALEQQKKERQLQLSKYSTQTFKQYAKNFFVLNKCPHYLRLKSEGRELTERYLHKSRLMLENVIFKTDFASVKMNEISKKTILNLRESLLENHSAHCVNQLIRVISTILSEAVYREDMETNPIIGMNSLKTEKEEISIYTAEDYKKMFPIDDVEKLAQIWGSYADFLIEYIECNSGMRISEVRCLKWKNVDLQNNLIYVREAFKDDRSTIIGKPKNGKERVIGICDNLRKMLILYKENYTDHIDDEDFVCCYNDGRPFGRTHTKNHHKDGLKKLGVEHRKQHTYRHTFNSNLLMENNVSDAEIRSAVGWGGKAIQNNYTHIEVNSAHKVADAQNLFWQNASYK